VAPVAFDGRCYFRGFLFQRLTFTCVTGTINLPLRQLIGSKTSGNLMVPFLKKSPSIFLPLTRRGVLTSHLRGYSYSERRGSFMSDVKSSSSFRHSTGFNIAHRKPLLEKVLKI